MAFPLMFANVEIIFLKIAGKTFNAEPNEENKTASLKNTMHITKDMAICICLLYTSPSPRDS